MKLLTNLSVIFVLLCITSCSTSNHVNSERLIQKRKYTKGLFVSKNYKWKENKYKSKDKILVSSSGKKDLDSTLSVIIDEKATTSSNADTLDHHLLADVKENFDLFEHENKSLIEKQIIAIRKDTKTLRESKISKENADPPEINPNGEKRWMLVLSIVFSVATILLVGILNLADEGTGGLSIFILLVLFLLLAAVLIIIYIKKRKGDLKPMDRLLFFLSLLSLGIGAFFGSVIGGGWTILPLLICGPIFLITLIASLIIYVKKNREKKEHIERSSNPSFSKARKLLLFSFLFLLACFALTIILSLWSESIFFLYVIMILTLLFLLSTLVLIINYFIQRSRVN